MEPLIDVASSHFNIECSVIDWKEVVPDTVDNQGPLFIFNLPTTCLF